MAAVDVEIRTRARRSSESSPKGSTSPFSSGGVAAIENPLFAQPIQLRDRLSSADYGVAQLPSDDAEESRPVVNFVTIFALIGVRNQVFLSGILSISPGDLQWKART